MESNNIHYALRSQRIGEGEHGEQGMEWNGVKKIAPRNDPRTILNCSLHSTRPSRSIFTAWSARIFMEFKTLLWWSVVQCNAVP